MMNKIKEGYTQIFTGVIGLIVTAPGLFIFVGVLVLIAKYIKEMAVWLWIL